MKQDKKLTTELQVMRNIEYELNTLKEHMQLTNTNETTALLICNTSGEQLNVQIGSERNIINVLIQTMCENPLYANDIIRRASLFRTYRQHTGQDRSSFVRQPCSSNATQTLSKQEGR